MFKIRLLYCAYNIYFEYTFLIPSLYSESLFKNNIPCFRVIHIFDIFSWHERLITSDIIVCIKIPSVSYAYCMSLYCGIIIT